MIWSSLVRSLFTTTSKNNRRSRDTLLALEHLEERVVLYSVTGNAWPNPAVITISFMPDGTQLSSAVGSTITSNLFSAFNAKFGSTAAWENQILRAAQVWAQQSNINFTVVADNGAPSGSGSYQEGNPGFGDIRIGGYVYGNSTLANAYYPPSINNYSIAGDIVFNTGQTFNIGSTYDLFTVASHEFGHALGLGESSAGTSSIMYPSYTSLKSVLSSDDIAGIRNIYSGNNPRSSDGVGGSLSAATNVTSLIGSSSLTALDSNLSLATTSQTDWFTYTAPSATTSTMQVQVQSTGLSLLSPKVIVYAANGYTVLGSASGANQYGTTLHVNVTGVTPGEQFYVKVQGADTTAFSTGEYALALNFGTGSTPVEASPVQQIPNGSPLSGGGGVADNGDNSTAGDNMLNSVPVITGLTPDNGTSSADHITNTPNITLLGTAPDNNIVQVFLQTSNGLQYQGATQANGQNQWSWTYSGTPLAAGSYTFYATAVDDLTGIQSSLSSSFPVTISSTLPAAPTLSVNDPFSGSPIGFSSVTTPVAAGTADANVAISVYVDGKLSVAQSGATYSTMSDSQGNWSYTLPSGLSGGAHTITATAMTAAGITGPVSVPYTFMVTNSNLNQPVITGIEPASASNTTAYASVLNIPKVKITGLADSGATVNVYQSNGGPIMLIGTTSADSIGHWVFDYSHTTLAGGTYSFIATETTSAGSSQASQTFNATIILTTPSTPTITGLAASRIPGGNVPPVAAPSQALLGTAPAGDTVNVFLNDQPVGTTTATPQGNWIFNFAGVTLQRVNNFTAQAVDAAGNVSSPSHPYIFNAGTVPASPVITRFSPAYSGYSTGLTTTLSSGTTVVSYTNSQNPTLFGTAPASSFVEIFENGNYVGYTTSNSSGNWSYTAPNVGGLGIFDFSAVTLASTGLLSTASNALNLIVDTQAPVAPTLGGITPDTGIAGDNVTSSQQIKLFGTANAADTIDIYMSPNGSSTSVLVGSTVADSLGNWTFDYTHTSLAAGTDQFTATQTDLAGNTSHMSQPLNVTIDLTKPNTPVITGTAATNVPGGNLPPVAPPPYLLLGVSDAFDTINLFLNSQQVGSTTANEHGNWSFNFGNLSLQNGNNYFTAQAVEVAGNQSGISATYDVVSTQPPSAPHIQSFSPAYSGVAAGYTNSQTPTLSGTSVAGDYVEVYQNGSYIGYTTVSTSGNWSFVVPQALPNGPFSFTAVTLSPSGISSGASSPMNLTVDTHAPVAPAITGFTPDTGVVGDHITSSQQIILTGTGDAGTTINVYLNNGGGGNNSVLIGTVTVGSSGTWNLSYGQNTKLAAGTYSFTATETDLAGNTSQTNPGFAVTIDLTIPHMPVITGLAPTSAPGGNLPPVAPPSQVLVGTSDAGDTINVFLTNQQVGSTTATPQGNWSFNFGSLSLQNGNNYFTTQAVEVAGNQSTISASYTVVVSQAPNAPQIQSFTPSFNNTYTNSASPSLRGTASANDYVEVYVNGSYVGYTRSAGDGSWSYQAQNLSNNTSYTFTAVTLSPAGISSSNSSNKCSLTVDTQPPNAPNISGITPDSGVVGDKITNSQNIKIVGTSDANATISLYQGASSTSSGIFIGSVNANGSGNWTFDYSQTTLAAGSYVFTATETNIAGSVSQPSKPLNVIIDLTPPPAPVVTSIKNDSGVSSTDGITNVQTQVFNGTAIPNVTVQVFVDSNPVGTTTSDGGGNWSFDYTKVNLNQGTHLITSQVTDYVGNVSAYSAPLTVVIDLTPPNKPVVSSFSPDTGVSSTDGITNCNTPTVFGTADANSIVALYNGNLLLGTTTASAAGSWSIAIPQNHPLNDGTYKLQATATDSAGNVSQLSSNALNMTIVTKIGNVQLQGISPDNGLHNNDGITNVQNIKILGKSDPNDTINLFENGVSIGTTTADGSGNWTFDNTHNTLPEGTYQFTAQASDSAGNVSPISPSYQVVIDLTPPAAPLFAGISLSTDSTGNQTLAIGGQAEANSQVTVYLSGTALGNTNTNNQGQWNFNYHTTGHFANTTYQFKATAEDVAGNVGTQSSFKLLLGSGMQNLPTPQLTAASIISNNNGNITAIATPTFTGNAQAGTLVTIVDGNVVLGTTTADSHGHWTFTSPTLAGGHHSVSVFATDSTGDEGLLSNPLAFQV